MVNNTRNTDGWTDMQRAAFDAFEKWRGFVHKVHDRDPSPISTSLDEDGVIFVETDGFFWSIDEMGELDTVS